MGSYDSLDPTGYNDAIFTSGNSVYRDLGSVPGYLTGLTEGSEEDDRHQQKTHGQAPLGHDHDKELTETSPMSSLFGGPGGTGSMAKVQFRK